MTDAFPPFADHRPAGSRPPSSPWRPLTRHRRPVDARTAGAGDAHAIRPTLGVGGLGGPDGVFSWAWRGGICGGRWYGSKPWRRAANQSIPRRHLKPPGARAGHTGGGAKRAQGPIHRPPVPNPEYMLGIKQKSGPKEFFFVYLPNLAVKRRWHHAGSFRPRRSGPRFG